MSVNLRRQTKTCLFWARFKTQRLPPGRWSACNQALDAVWHIWACFADHTCVSKKPQSGKRVPSGVKIPNVNTDLWPFLSFLSIIYICGPSLLIRWSFLAKDQDPKILSQAFWSNATPVGTSIRVFSFTPTLGVTMPSRTSCITKALEIIDQRTTVYTHSGGLSENRGSPKSLVFPCFP